jgi:hypothetical protein
MAPTQGELAALVFGLRHFSVFLRGRPKFIVRTDHKALLYLRSLAPQTGKLARWLYLIEAEFNIKFQHREGVKHRNADALSRAVAEHLDGSDVKEDDFHRTRQTTSLFSFLQTDYSEPNPPFRNSTTTN